ncbi:MAG: TetR/AcrR family transcriptional regulator [Bacteroidota bacterium]
MAVKQSVKERILETASQLFYEKGYNNTGINEIIEKASIAKASLYANFRSKEALCIAYLQRKDHLFLSQLRAYLAKLPAGKDQLLGFFDFLLEFYHSDGFRGCWCLNTLSEIPADSQAIRDTILKQKNSFRALIRSVVDEHMPDFDADRLSNRIYLLYEGAITESYLHKAEWPIKDAKALIADLL